MIVLCCYVCVQSLELYMFDDGSTEEKELPGYLGVAHVPLLDLSLGKPISGTFQLKQVSILTLEHCF